MLFSLWKKKKLYVPIVTLSAMDNQKLSKLFSKGFEKTVYLNYTTGCSWNYDYIKNHYRLISVDLSRKNEFNVDPKSFQQAKFTGQLKYPDSEIVAKESMFVLTILEKFKETRLKFSQGSVTVLWKITNY